MKVAVKTQTFLMVFSPDQKARAMRFARQNKRSLAAIIRELLEGEIQKQERKAA